MELNFQTTTDLFLSLLYISLVLTARSNATESFIGAKTSCFSNSHLKCRTFPSAAATKRWAYVRRKATLNKHFHRVVARWIRDPGPSSNPELFRWTDRLCIGVTMRCISRIIYRSASSIADCKCKMYIRECYLWCYFVVVAIYHIRNIANMLTVYMYMYGLI